MHRQDRIGQAMRNVHAAGKATGKMANAMVELREAGLLKITPEMLDELDSFFRLYFHLLDTLVLPAHTPTAMHSDMSSYARSTIVGAGNGERRIVIVALFRRQEEIPLTSIRKNRKGYPFVKCILK